MGKVALIFTGGTIAMKIDKNLDGAIPSLSPNDIVSTLSGIDEFDNLEVYEFSRKQSPAITPFDMKRIASKVQEYLDQRDVSGVVVIHGTDVLEETAFYLNSVIKSAKPVLEQVEIIYLISYMSFIHVKSVLLPDFSFRLLHPPISAEYCSCVAKSK